MLPEQKNVGNEFASRFERIDCGDGIIISVQGNTMAYCSPRENLSSLNDYVELEMACFVNDSWAVPEKYTKLFESGHCPVAGYVPFATVCEIVRLAKDGELTFEMR